MNSIHDMGGMHGFGPIAYEEKEPVFHAPWEGRLYGMRLAFGQDRIFAPLGMRSALESLDPAVYLASSYYERWLLVTYQALIEKGFLTLEELEAKIEEFRDRFANPYKAAEKGWIDEVIEPRQTRAKLIAALKMLENKADTTPRKKHGNIPL